jgi:hypothetical protein
MLQNVNTLKWATYYGRLVGYDLLRGFPGEKAEHYADELRAPRSIGAILLTSIHAAGPDYGLAGCAGAVG